MSHRGSPVRIMARRLGGQRLKASAKVCYVCIPLERRLPGYIFHASDALPGRESAVYVV